MLYQKMKHSNKIIDSGYCIITVGNGSIRCSYFRLSSFISNQYYQIDLYSSSAVSLFNLINQHSCLSQSISLSHALYLGKEIYKAELSRDLLQTYIQV